MICTPSEERSVIFWRRYSKEWAAWLVVIFWSFERFAYRITYCDVQTTLFALKRRLQDVSPASRASMYILKMKINRSPFKTLKSFRATTSQTPTRKKHNSKQKVNKSLTLCSLVLPLPSITKRLQYSTLDNTISLFRLWTIHLHLFLLSVRFCFVSSFDVDQQQL